ncbi:hypothetical protein TSOC_001642 [Tetrabaena socialis]|uniref:5'-3' DNA helicase ZGRF1-like N-terminal domain-containing protein n=1 Tax=Tetrabaena socialis TaxID=47790 RepID=A0A2J8AGA2_9CHLO|nr:hypothetical protein TSOC_001642 [Tetrabaena socialis]|eukprot:PNH11551.1 hypothetical protein TSOC_001642 [Tetrabaena socialis]
MQFHKCLYTKHLVKKRKTWEDGFIRFAADGDTSLHDADGKLLESGVRLSADALTASEGPLKQYAGLLVTLEEPCPPHELPAALAPAAHAAPAATNFAQTGRAPAAPPGSAWLRPPPAGGLGGSGPVPGPGAGPACAPGSRRVVPMLGRRAGNAAAFVPPKPLNAAAAAPPAAAAGPPLGAQGAAGQQQLPARLHAAAPAAAAHRPHPPEPQRPRAAPHLEAAWQQQPYDPPASDDVHVPAGAAAERRWQQQERATQQRREGRGAQGEQQAGWGEQASWCGADAGLGAVVASNPRDAPLGAYGSGAALPVPHLAAAAPASAGDASTFRTDDDILALLGFASQTTAAGTPTPQHASTVAPGFGGPSGPHASSCSGVQPPRATPTPQLAPSRPPLPHGAQGAYGGANGRGASAQEGRAGSERTWQRQLPAGGQQQPLKRRRDDDWAGLEDDPDGGVAADDGGVGGAGGPPAYGSRRDGGGCSGNGGGGWTGNDGGGWGSGAASGVSQLVAGDHEGQRGDAQGAAGRGGAWPAAAQGSKPCPADGDAAAAQRAAAAAKRRWGVDDGPSFSCAPAAGPPAAPAPAAPQQQAHHRNSSGAAAAAVGGAGDTQAGPRQQAAHGQQQSGTRGPDAAPVDHERGERRAAAVVCGWGMFEGGGDEGAIDDEEGGVPGEEEGLGSMDRHGGAHPHPQPWPGAPAATAAGLTDAAPRPTWAAAHGGTEAGGAGCAGGGGRRPDPSLPARAAAARARWAAPQAGAAPAPTAQWQTPTHPHQQPQQPPHQPQHHQTPQQQQQQVTTEGSAVPPRPPQREAWKPPALAARPGLGASQAAGGSQPGGSTVGANGPVRGGGGGGGVGGFDALVLPPLDQPAVPRRLVAIPARFNSAEHYR